MRISDWSSDVCSSDLAKSDCDGRLAAGGELARRAGAAPAPEQQHQQQARDQEYQHCRPQQDGRDNVVPKADRDVALDARLQGVQAGAAEGLIDLVPALAEHGEAPGAGAERRHGIPPQRQDRKSELQSLMRISYAVFCLKKKNKLHNYYLIQL